MPLKKPLKAGDLMYEGCNKKLILVIEGADTSLKAVRLEPPIVSDLSIDTFERGEGNLLVCNLNEAFRIMRIQFEQANGIRP